MSAVHGRCDERFTAIKALAEQLAVEDDDGFALAVEVDGKLVVDLWAGRASEASLIHTFSTVKPLSACALLQQVERGEVTLSTTLGTIWPELSTQVATCTIADALGHRCGLIGVPNGSIEGLLDWDTSIAAIAASEPLWTPGAAHGEHAFTYGHLIGELVRRITGQSIGSFIRSEISEAHDIDVHIGLGSEELGRVTDIATDPDFWSSIGWTSREALAALGADPGIGADVVNSARWRTGEVPAVNGHASARGLARFWSLVLDGTLPSSVMEVAGTGRDLVIGEQITWTLGSAQLDTGRGGIGMADSEAPSQVRSQSTASHGLSCHCVWAISHESNRSRRSFTDRSPVEPTEASLAAPLRRGRPSHSRRCPSRLSPLRLCHRGAHQHALGRKRYGLCSPLRHHKPPGPRVVIDPLRSVLLADG